MKKHIAKILKKIAEEKSDVTDKVKVKSLYKKLKKGWKENVKNAKEIK